jgi:hypothetical protein
MNSPAWSEEEIAGDAVVVFGVGMGEEIIRDPDRLLFRETGGGSVSKTWRRVWPRLSASTVIGVP